MSSTRTPHLSAASDDEWTFVAPLAGPHVLAFACLMLQQFTALTLSV
ncbi:MAG TPA: hypothetical protein VF510_02555 [Ktedonobacterales bacterium]